MELRSATAKRRRRLPRYDQRDRLSSFIMSSSGGVASSLFWSCCSLTEVLGAIVFVSRSFHQSGIASIRSITSDRNHDNVAFAGRYRSLRTLHLTRRYEITNIDIAQIESCSALRSFAVHSGVESIAAIANCKLLTSIDISGCFVVVDIRPLSLCRSLTYLNMAYCDRIVDISPLASCAAITHLNLSFCLSISDFTSISACTGLIRLEIDRCATSVGIPEAISSCSSSLVSLHVSIDDISAVSSCVALKWLRIYFSNIINLSSLFSCRTLTVLDISVCNSLTDITPLSYSALRSLRLSVCDSLVDISPIGSCVDLLSLTIAYCFKVADITPLSRCVALTFLDLSGCSSTDISALSECTALRRLSVLNTSIDTSILQASLPSLSISA